MSRPRVKPIRAFWGGLWVLEWSKKCNFLLYTIIMERQETTYIEFRVKWHHADGLKEGDSTILTLPYLLNDIETVFVSNRFRHFGMSYECWKGENLKLVNKDGLKNDDTPSFKLLLISLTIVSLICKAFGQFGDLFVMEWSKVVISCHIQS